MHTKLVDFLELELKKRDMSIRQFALYVGVAPSTISRAIDHRNPTIPELSILARIAKKLEIDFFSLVALAVPEGEVTDISPEARILAQEIMQLPPDQQQLVRAMVRGLVLQASQSASE